MPSFERQLDISHTIDPNLTPEENAALLAGDLELAPLDEESNPNQEPDLSDDSANDSQFGMESIGHTDNVLEVRPGAEQSFRVESEEFVSEQRPTGPDAITSLTKRARFGELKRATQDLLKGAYESVKNTTPVQNALDRFRVWKSAKMAALFEGRVRAAAEQQKQANRESDAAATRAASGRKSMNDLKASMERLGMTVSPEALKSAEVEIALAEDRERQYGQEAGVRGVRVAELQKKYESYQNLVASASERINARLTAKQEGNNEVLKKQRAEEEKLLVEKRQIEAERAKVEAQYQALETQIQSMVRGGLRKALESSMKDLAQRKEKQLRSLGHLGEVLAVVQSEIASLEKQNTDLEVRKVRPKIAETVESAVPAGPEVDIPVQPPVPTKRSARRKYSVAMG